MFKDLIIVHANSLSHLLRVELNSTPYSLLWSRFLDVTQALCDILA